MALKETVAELRQERAGLVAEAREIMEKVGREKRAMTVDERNRHEEILGSEEKPGGMAMDLAQRISAMSRSLAIADMPVEGESDRRSAPLPHEDPANVRPTQRYSLFKAIKCRVAGKPVDGLEGEVHEELAKRTKKEVLGFLMPYSTRGVLSDAERRALDSGAGGASVPTAVSKDWIELLRNQLVMVRAGMREILNVEGRLALPRQSGASTGFWVGESGSPTGSNQTLDQVIFNPHTVGAFTDISRRFFELSNSTDPEGFVKEDLTAVIARAVDLAALNGSGGSNQPLGLMQNQAVTANRTISLGTNGAAPAWASIVNLYTLVKRANAGDLGEFVYVSNADMEGTLATTAKIGSTFPIYLLENGMLNNKRFLTSQQVPNNLVKGSGTALSPIIGGVFNQLIAAYWSGVDIIVDPFTGSTSGTVRIAALQDMDVQVRHNEAFAFIVDAVSNQT